MRSAGCVINDIFDQNFDKNVERTKNRPIAAGKISTKQAAIFLTFLLFLGFLILIQFNEKTILAGIFSLILVFSYPLTKRVTYYPQVFLGLTFNFGIIMASFATLGKLTSASIILYVACIIWTVIYDSIYAFQDIEDDLKIGVKSSAIKFQNNPKVFIISLIILHLLFLLYLGQFMQFSGIYFIMILIADLTMIKKIKYCDFKSSKSCLKIFNFNVCSGIMVLLSLTLGVLFK
jgi:4-hydroxybenzoate polyprenyl transferase